MTRAPFLSAMRIVLAVQVAWGGAALIHAQRARIRPRPIDETRAVFLQNWATDPLTVAPSGVVLLGSSGPGLPARPALVSVRLDGSVSVQLLEDILYGNTIGEVWALSGDGTLVAGYGLSPTALYFEGTWWAQHAPQVPHGIGGSASVIHGIENTPSGMVLVGTRDGLSFDVRPGGGGNLPGLPPRNGGSAMGLSADGEVYCGWVEAYQLESKAVRWVDRVPQALGDPVGTRSKAYGVSSSGANFAGDTFTGSSNSPAVWLAQEGLALRTLRDRDGGVLQGIALGVLDDGFAFGQSFQGFGWIWHPSSGTDRVTRIEDWLAHWGVHTTPIDTVRDVQATKGSYHFSLGSGQDSWYVKTPKAP